MDKGTKFASLVEEVDGYPMIPEGFSNGHDCYRPLEKMPEVKLEGTLVNMVGEDKKKKVKSTIISSASTRCQMNLPSGGCVEIKGEKGVQLVQTKDGVIIWGL